MSPDPAELRTAVRSLLGEPLTDATDTAFPAIRRNRRELARWFADELGYRLDATRPSVARLAKCPGPAHRPRGLATRSGRRFDGRRYGLTCLVMAAAENAGEHTTLQRLFEDVGLRASGVEGLEWDGQVAADRRVFIQAVQALQDLGVFERADGDEERFARGEAGGDALYRIDRDRLSLLPTTAQPPSLAASPGDIAEEPYPDTEQGRILRRRHRVTRALVEEPVVHREDLTDEEADYLRSQRGRLERLLADKVGLTLEVRGEGWVTVDEAGELTDLRWPDYGTAETAALRLCDELRARRLRGDPEAWPMAEVTCFVRDLAEEYAGYWKKGAEDGAGATRLVEEAVDILVAARLAVRDGAELRALPAAGRFAALEAVRPEPTRADPARPDPPFVAATPSPGGEEGAGGPGGDGAVLPAGPGGGEEPR
ncbi:MAG TPA: TIGR02678 family protein [Acidimicrobiales bacterium]|jgi:uncharacterized protein (TIGR02678 family)|nr:TIGR02678 family protein [Acidimicrobiales bacterium]